MPSPLKLDRDLESITRGSGSGVSHDERIPHGTSRLFPAPLNVARGLESQGRTLESRVSSDGEVSEEETQTSQEGPNGAASSPEPAPNCHDRDAPNAHAGSDTTLGADATPGQYFDEIVRLLGSISFVKNDGESHAPSPAVTRSRLEEIFLPLLAVMGPEWSGPINELIDDCVGPIEQEGGPNEDVPLPTHDDDDDDGEAAMRHLRSEIEDLGKCIKRVGRSLRGISSEAEEIMETLRRISADLALRRRKRKRANKRLRRLRARLASLQTQ